MKTLLKHIISALCLLTITTSSFAQIRIVLRKTFVDSIKNQVTIAAKYKIVKAHKHPNAPSKDGDMHIAGEAKKIGLPIVAEIMNAKFEGEAVDFIHANEGSGNAVSLTGVWRIWPEHAGQDIQDQSKGFPPIVNTNPDHVFEIHPITRLGNIDCIQSLRPIDGFTYKKAEDAFSKYANVRCALSENGSLVTILTNGIGYNYVDFWIEIIDNHPFVTNDGRFVFCRVLEEKDGDVLNNKMRMAFPKGSDAEMAVRNMRVGDQMHVIGIPRVDLALVSFRLSHADENPELLNWNLPVEMVVVAENNE